MLTVSTTTYSPTFHATTSTASNNRCPPNLWLLTQMIVHDPGTQPSSIFQIALIGMQIYGGCTLYCSGSPSATHNTSVNTSTHCVSALTCIYSLIYLSKCVFLRHVSPVSRHALRIDFPSDGIKLPAHQYLRSGGIAVHVTWWNSLWCWTAPTSPPMGSCSDSSSSLAVSHSMISCRESCSFPLLSEKASSRTLPTNTHKHTQLVQQTVHTLLHNHQILHTILGQAFS